MLRSLQFYILLLLALPAGAQDSLQPVSLIPQPANLQLSGGTYTLPKTVRISLPKNNPAIDFIQAEITRKLNNAAGILVAVVNSGDADMVLQLYTSPDQKLGREGYRLVVGANRIEISANEPAGLFYGLQTLWQLFPAAIESRQSAKDIVLTAPRLSITDTPRFAWRGLMLDVARHFFTKEQVKEFIDNMVRYKYNMLHLHLTDDQGWRIEIKSLPRLTEVGAFRAARTGRWGEFKPQQPGEASNYGGYYKQDDIRELLAYAKDRFVTILPEIDIPGHSLAMVAAYPELSCTPGTYQVSVGNRFMIWPGNGTFYGILDNNLCPANEQVYSMLDKIFTEVAALFPFEYIHMGGDETYKGFWGKKRSGGCPDEKGKAERHA